MNNGQMSPMQEYMSTYGDRLQSLLDGGPMPPPDQSQLAPGDATAYPDTTPSAAPAGAAAPAAPGLAQAPVGMPQQPPQQSAQASSFRQKWDESTDDQKKQFTDDLEEQLKKGNKTIDSAYDDLERQMGTKADSGLSREEKGMMLMEFGLSLMANSSAKAYGNDLGAAIGASGSQVMQGFRARQAQRDTELGNRRFQIEKQRADSKSELAKQIVLEGRSEARDQRRADRENSQIASTITQPDDTVAGVTRGGNVVPLNIGGNKLKAKPKPTAAGGSGSGSRPLEFDRRYQLYLETFGKGASGSQLETVKQRALQFAADPKAATLSDAEMRTMAERSADNFQRSNWASFRDKTPQEIQKWRDDNAEQIYQRLKRGEDAALALPTPPGPGAHVGKGSSQLAQPSSAGSQLAPPAQPNQPSGSRTISMPSMEAAQAAIKNRQLKKGDVVTVGNRSFRVQ